MVASSSVNRCRPLAPLPQARFTSRPLTVWVRLPGSSSGAPRRLVDEETCSGPPVAAVRTVVMVRLGLTPNSYVTSSRTGVTPEFAHGHATPNVASQGCCPPAVDGRGRGAAADGKQGGHRERCSRESSAHEMRYDAISAAVPGPSLPPHIHRRPQLVFHPVVRGCSLNVLKPGPARDARPGPLTGMSGVRMVWP